MKRFLLVVIASLVVATPAHAAGRPHTRIATQTPGTAMRAITSEVQSLAWANGAYSWRIDHCWHDEPGSLVCNARTFMVEDDSSWCRYQVNVVRFDYRGTFGRTTFGRGGWRPVLHTEWDLFASIKLGGVACP